MRTGTVSNMQKRAAAYYGFAGSPNLPVGEVRYVVGWHADQITRLDWDVLIDGSDSWKVQLPQKKDDEGKDVDGGTISTIREDGEENLTEASAELLDLVGWDDANIRAVDTNLFVTGEGDYCRFKDKWRVVSVVENKRKEIVAEADEVVPFIWPHPFDPKKPDAPLFSVLELLDELEWLNLQARTQSKQRVMFSGIVATATELEGPDGASFWDVWNDTLSARTHNPDDMSPVRLSGPIGNGQGPNVIKDGLNWIMPPFGYDQTIDRRVIAGIQRLAYGLPIPPEILLGLQAQSRATAFQVEENAYRAHIEPPAWMVAQVAQDALAEILDGVTVEVVPNPSRMLARKQSVQDVKDAYDRGLVTPEYVREVLGIPDDAKPEDDGVPPAGTPSAPGTDPANDAADDPVTAANTGENIGDLLADIDAHLSSELAGVTVMATDRARQRLGAYARRNETVKNAKELNGLSGAQVAHRLGVDGLTAAGVDVAQQMAEPIDSAARWWVRRVGEAWEQAATLVPGWTGQGDWITESTNLLVDSLTAHIVSTLGEPDSPPLQAGDIRDVLNAAAGGTAA